jgi:LacI family transcriptional regulator
MANIKDVAKQANVSVATVSRVINNKGYVNEETRKLVEEAIKKLNYIPNEFARSLFKKVSRTVGVIFPHLSNSFYYSVLEGIEDVAFDAGYKVMICNSHEDPVREEEYIKQFVKYNIDGLITGSNSDASMISKYKELNIPIVSIDRILSEEIPSVTSDNVGGGYMAANKLVNSGCRHIVHFRGPSVLLTVEQRTQGFQQCLTKHGLTCSQVDLAFVDPEVELIREFLVNHPEIDGVFCDSDQMAAIVLSELHYLGKDVPNDVQVIGYDNTLLSTLISPKLSTVSQRMVDIGKEAMISLMTLIDDGNKELERHKLIPVDFIERETTKI